MAAPEDFVPLAAWLAGPPSPAAAPSTDDVAVTAQPPEPAPSPPPCEPVANVDDVLRDVRLFRAHLADALVAAAARLACDLAYAVLGRELTLAPSDLDALVGRILTEHAAAEPLAVHHAPGEHVVAPVRTVADPALAPGDLALVFADGRIDARLGVRLAVALEAWT